MMGERRSAEMRVEGGSRLRYPGERKCGRTTRVLPRGLATVKIGIIVKVDEPKRAEWPAQPPCCQPGAPRSPRHGPITAPACPAHGQVTGHRQQVTAASRAGLPPTDR